MKKSLLSFVAVAMLFASCSKDDNNSVDPNNPSNGEKVFTTFSLNLNAPTRSTDSGIDGENKVVNAKFYVFNAGLFEAEVGIDVADIDPSDGLTSEVLEITTGVKDVYVVVNVNGNNLLDPAFTPEVGVTTIEQVKAQYLEDYDASVMAEENDFIMFGNAQPNIKGGMDIPVDVYRASAKVSFVYNAADVTVDPTKFQGTISSPGFTVAQSAKQVDITRTYRSSDDVNYETTAPTGAFEDATPSDGTYDHLKAGISHVDDFIAASADFGNSTGASIANSIYVAENVIKGIASSTDNGATSTGKASAGEVTFVTVKLVYTPVIAEMFSGQTVPSTGTTFYRAKTNIGYLKGLFTEVPTTAHDPSITGYDEFTNGVMYYRLNLNDPTKGADELKRYSVLRNSNYQIRIENVFDFGVKDPADLIPTDPQTPIVPDINLTATMNIIPWSIVDMPSNLE